MSSLISWGIRGRPTPLALSLGSVDLLTRWKFLGRVDFLFGNLSLTVGGFLMCLFVAYKWGLKSFMEAISQGSEVDKVPAFRIWYGVSVFLICPVCMAGMILYILITGNTLG